ncbi:MAG: aldo/keto reductase, partial [Bacteroidota bacterium]
KHDIHVTAYSPLGSLDRPDRLKKASNPVPLEDPVIQSIAKVHNCSPAQVLITWAIQRGTAVIPKSTNEGRLRQNFEAENIELSADEIEQIRGLDLATRIIDGGVFTVEGSPYTYENLWDEA